MSIEANITINRGITVNVLVGEEIYRNQYFYYDDGTNEVRRGVRDGHDVYDVALTETGFDGTQGIDWKNKEKDPIQ